VKRRITLTVLLTKERYQQLLETQAAFDARVPEYDINNIKIAYLVEFFEWWNTLETFKGWKQNKGKPKHVQLDELADLLAFGLSMQNYQSGTSGTHNIVSDGLDMRRFNNENFLNDLTTLVHGIMYEIDYSIHVFLPIAISNMYYTVPELLGAYEAKMIVNHERQDNKY